MDSMVSKNKEDCMMHVNSIPRWISDAFSEIFALEANDRSITPEDSKRLLEAVYRAMESNEMWAPTHLELLVSEECNLRCDYCFMQTKNPRTMSPEIGKQCVDFLLRECEKEKQLGILFFGGEPLLAFSTIRTIVEYASGVLAGSGRTISYSLTTNGTLFNEEIADFCRAHQITPLLSIDGPAEVHDAHRKTCTGGGTYALIESKLPVIFEYFDNPQVRVTPHPDTVGRLSKSIEHLVGLGFRRFIIGATHGVEWHQTDYQVYDSEMKRVIDAAFEGNKGAPRFRIDPVAGAIVQCNFGCRAGKGYVSVGADGRLGPCSLIMGTPGLEKRYVFGTVREGFTRDLLRKEFNVIQSYRTGECLQCDIVKTCGGGCPGTNYKVTGSIVHPANQQCQDNCYRLSHQRIWHDYLSNRSSLTSREE